MKNALVISISKTLLSFVFSCFMLSTSAQNDPQLWVDGNGTGSTSIFFEDFSVGFGSFSSGGFPLWTRVAQKANSGLISGSGNSNYIETTVTIPANETGILSSQMSYSPQGNADGNFESKFEILVNGTVVMTRTGTTSSSVFPDVYFLKEGTNVIQWRVSIIGDDAIEATVDNVEIEIVTGHTFRLRDGNEGFGKILMSDATGNATWREFSFLSDFGNAGNGPLYPLELSGSGSNIAFISNNSSIGAYTYNNTTGILTSNNSGDGMRANSNEDNGIRVDNNENHGILSRYNLDNGLRTEFNNFGLVSNENIIGIDVINNDFEGIYSAGNGSYGIIAVGNPTNDGLFGTLQATSIAKGMGTFKIDHPLDPENKYLYHSFVESPDMMNIYNGNVILDQNGEAQVELPDYFEALNMDFRYQLTCIGGFAQVYIAEKIEGNQFKVAGGSPGLEISWQVTGVRNDPLAQKDRVVVEVDKELENKGYYLHAKAYNKGEDQSILGKYMKERAAETKVKR